MSPRWRDQRNYPGTRQFNGKVIGVSLETMGIVEGLSGLEISEEERQSYENWDYDNCIGAGCDVCGEVGGDV